VVQLGAPPGDKTWFGRDDILRMINYYCYNRGIDVDSLT